jgi:uncharacterized protein (DUF4415 family)
MGKIVRRTVEEVRAQKISPKRLAEIDAIADSAIDYSDIPPLTEKFWANAVHRPEYYRPVKKQVTVRVDADVLEWLKKKAEKGYQSRLNQVLREAMMSELLKKSA